MNFLAHIYLSGNDQEVAFGNFIGDFVKGKYEEEFPEKIAKGISLHRKIDEFTDKHEIFKKSKSLLRPIYGHYPPVIMDIFYDHILAKNWHKYHDQTLQEFTSQFYQTCEHFKDLLPSKSVRLVEYMTKENWLYNYGNLEGIQKTFDGMARRSSFKSNMERATEDLRTNFSQLESDFDRFFPQVKVFAQEFIKKND